jgi:hypothetical protein
LEAEARHGLLLLSLPLPARLVRAEAGLEAASRGLIVHPLFRSPPGSSGWKQVWTQLDALHPRPTLFSLVRARLVQTCLRPRQVGGERRFRL